MADSEFAVRLEIGQFSHRGRRRPNNEDWLGTFQPDDAGRLTRKGRLFLVADGMGGHQSGEMASRQAVDQVIRAYMDDSEPDLGTSLLRAIEAANATLYARAAGVQGRWRSGTTLVVAVVRGAELWIANVGDSRAYLLRAAKLSRLSHDHTLFPESPDGSVSSERRPGQHIITRALGTRPEVKVDLFPARRLRPGDRILLCSDGLTTPLSDDEICRIMVDQPAQKSAEALVQAANDRGGPDNVSVIVIHIVDLIRNRIPGILLRFEAWQEALQQLLCLVPGASQGLESPLFLVIILLFILALIGLGVVLGLILF